MKSRVPGPADWVRNKQPTLELIIGQSAATLLTNMKLHKYNLAAMSGQSGDLTTPWPAELHYEKWGNCLCAIAITSALMKHSTVLH